MNPPVSNIAGDGVTMASPCNPQDTERRMPAWQAQGNKSGEGLRARKRAPTGARHNIDAEAGIERQKKQVQHATWLQAGKRTTTNAVRITDRGERADTHTI